MRKYFLFLLFFVIAIPVSAQNEIEHIQLSGSRIRTSIQIVAEQKKDGVAFYAVNESFYRFDLTLEIDEIINLSPARFSRTYTIGFGRTHLKTLKVVDYEQGISYNYNYRYGLAESDDPPVECSYLHPIGENRYVTNFNPVISYRIGTNYYPLSDNDTVFAMRKGVVVADNVKMTVESRLYPQGSLEILHDDGTVSVYMPFDEDDESFIKRGEEVYPGQPLYVNKTGETVLKIGVYRIASQYFQGIRPKFNCCKNVEEGDSCRVSYPEEVITQEMSKSEIRKFSKGKLY